jgi:hypothetical protein
LLSLQEDMLARAFERVIDGEDMADWPAMGRAVLALVARHWGGLPGSKLQTEQQQVQEQQRRQEQEQQQQQMQMQMQQMQGQGEPAAGCALRHPGAQDASLPQQLKTCLRSFFNALELSEYERAEHASLLQQQLLLLEASAAAGAWEDCESIARELHNHEELCSVVWAPLMDVVCKTLTHVSAAAVAVADLTMREQQVEEVSWSAACYMLVKLLAAMVEHGADALGSTLQQRGVTPHLLQHLAAILGTLEVRSSAAEPGLCYAAGTAAAGLGTSAGASSRSDKAAAGVAATGAAAAHARQASAAATGLVGLLHQLLPAVLPELQQTPGAGQLMERIMQVSLPRAAGTTF